MNGKIIGGLISGVFGLIMLVTVVPAEFKAVQQENIAIQQTKNLLNQVDLNSIDMCMNTTSLGDLESCKTQLLPEIQNDCKDPSKYVQVCDDPRISQFFTTVDARQSELQTHYNSLASSVNTNFLDILNSCMLVKDASTLSSCQSMVLDLQQKCNSGQINITACSDPRINQILNEQINTPTNVYDAASQNMETKINLCLANMTRDCISWAKQSLDLCQSTQVQACNDPRLQQIATAGQDTSQRNVNPQTVPLDTANSQDMCPQIATIQAIIMKNSLGVEDFNSTAVSLRSADTIMFKSLDERPHLLSSYTDGVRNWFVHNGGLVSVNQPIDFPLNMFNGTETTFTVFDTYDPDISISVDVTPTPSYCLK